jgi:uncharacterized membrane protein YheB (UPF0754 family)
MNKSLITNLVSLMAIGLGAVLQQPWLWTMGIFAFSGAITNWLAVHMLFEKVPGLYGSGVIPARFTELKQALYTLIMQQFFNQTQLQKFMQQPQLPQLDIGKLMANVDLSPAFDALLDTVQKSSLGGMLAMFGGAQMLMPLKQPFIDNLTQSLSTIANSDDVQVALRQQLSSADSNHAMEQTIASLVQSRLDELTPELVKTMMQQLIAEHLGWLVVWGGVFGALLGLINHLFTVTVLS